MSIVAIHLYRLNENIMFRHSFVQRMSERCYSAVFSAICSLGMLSIDASWWLPSVSYQVRDQVREQLSNLHARSTEPGGAMSTRRIYTVTRVRIQS
jgi:hypothetical protein